MATRIIPETTAPTHYVELADSDGRLVLVPAATWHALRSAGVESITVQLSRGGDAGVELTVTEAARQLMCDLRPPIDRADEERLLMQAKAAICRACERGQLRSRGARRARRIDAASFAEWCLARRRRADLD